MADTKISAFASQPDLDLIEGLAGYEGAANKKISGIDLKSQCFTTYLTGIIDGLSSATHDFTQFGGTLAGVTDQGSGFAVFDDCHITHMSFKYLSDDPLVASADSYVVSVYESNVGFDSLPADDLTSYTAIAVGVTVNGDGVGGSNYGTFPFASLTFFAPIAIQSGKFYAIVGERSGAGGGLFPVGEEAQITLRLGN